MNKGQFENQVLRAKGMLKAARLFLQHNESPIYPSGMAAIARSMPYIELWHKMVNERMYDLRLIDSSIIQFRYELEAPATWSYSYLPCPLEAENYDDFVARNEEADWGLRSRADRIAAYDEYLSTCAGRMFTTPIRYDSKPPHYRPARHPASHLHFGIDNEIRVATFRYWRPLTFVFFVIRHQFPAIWEEFVKTPAVQGSRSQFRHVLTPVEPIYRSEICLLESHIE